mmetsp:Transcript_10652/g.28449  ORF Transcript_10652/g.28449 Transcript_10652/m.28449 type:complete len:241 (-) Transcript_10652:289-1011(-)
MLIVQHFDFVSQIADLLSGGLAVHAVHFFRRVLHEFTLPRPDCVHLCALCVNFRLQSIDLSVYSLPLRFELFAKLSTSLFFVRAPLSRALLVRHDSAALVFEKRKILDQTLFFGDRHRMAGVALFELCNASLQIFRGFDFPHDRLLARAAAGGGRASITAPAPGFAQLLHLRGQLFLRVEKSAQLREHFIELALRASKLLLRSTRDLGALVHSLAPLLDLIEAGLYLGFLRIDLARKLLL